jgi:DNA-binding transcriptional LysR family regulator
VQIDIRDMDSTAVLRELDKERVDLGLATAPGADASIAREELFSDDFGVVCRPDHPLARETGPIDWRALEPWTFVGNGICRHIADEDFQRVFNSSRLMVRNTTSLLAMVRAGVGVTVLPRLAVIRSESQLTFLPATDPAAKRRIDVLRRNQHALTPAAEAFAATIRRTAQAIVPTW